MSKSNNLTDFLTDVANAIRYRTGETGKINPQDFSNRIRHTIPRSQVGVEIIYLEAGDTAYVINGEEDSQLIVFPIAVRRGTCTMSIFDAGYGISSDCAVAAGRYYNEGSGCVEAFIVSMDGKSRFSDAQPSGIEITSNESSQELVFVILRSNFES